MRAKIIRIDEPDFGCEGRLPGMTVMDRVTLQNQATGETVVTEASDTWLYEMDINEGDLVNVEESANKIVGKWNHE